MAGGAMLGYCAIGKVLTASPPANMITIAITQAKIGLSMKKLTTCVPAYEPGWAGAVAGVALPGALGAALASLGAGSWGNSCTVTGEPGLANCTPSTMTRSPAFSPAVTSHLSPMARSVVRFRSSTVLSVLTTRAVG